MVTAVVLTFGFVYAAYADCGPGGTCPSGTKAATGVKESKATHANMPCGCPMTHESMQMHASMDVVQMAEHAGLFNTLMTAVNAAELKETLKAEGPFTIFAPTDDAFAKLPKTTLNALLNDKNQLRSVLTYHVHPGKAMAADVVKMKSIKTLNGQKAAVMVEPGGVMIDQAKVTTTDIRCSNGVIHVIDTVILPKKEAS